MSSREIVAVLVVAGAVLPLTGFAWGAVVGRRRLRELQRQRQRIIEVAATPADAIMAMRGDSVLRHEGIEVTAMDDLLRVRQDIELGILRHALGDLKGPAFLAALGIVAGTVGGVWSLYLPGS